jgi:glycosyltransferase involved in cell wall biosynthesis
MGLRGTASSSDAYAPGVHVVIADPPAYTPPYDHALAAALARRGVDVELLTSPFRFGERPASERYRLDESLYRRSSRMHGSRLRLVVKAVEHPAALRRLRRSRADVLHLQWLAAPTVDAWLLRAHAPLVFTAHDLLPRRTARRARPWRRFFGRTDRIVVHSRRGRDALVAFGVQESKLRVIPHPVFPAAVERRDDGATVLALGAIRSYKGLPDAVEAVLRADGARLLVAGDPRIPLGELRRRAGSRAEWRLGYLPQLELSRAVAESTVAVFPYAAELDQSGALLQALGAGVPVVVYDVGGLGEPVAAFGAGRVVPAGDVDALAAALRELLDDAGKLAAARAGAERARAELTWDAAAAAHVDLYRELS